MPDTTSTLRTETMMINMGPQHPSTHGVLRLVLELDGENVVSAATTVGYLHTGIEKTAEQKKYQQVIPLVERMDYLSSHSNSCAFALAVEKLLGVEVPERVSGFASCCWSCSGSTATWCGSAHTAWRWARSPSCCTVSASASSC
jgi:NADH:ubiquinone oxidoreductase subunit D